MRQGGEPLDVSVQGPPVSGTVLDLADGSYQVSIIVGGGDDNELYEEGACFSTCLQTSSARKGYMSMRDSSGTWSNMWFELDADSTFNCYVVEDGNKQLPALIAVPVDTLQFAKDAHVDDAPFGQVTVMLVRVSHANLLSVHRTHRTHTPGPAVSAGLR